MTYFTQTATSNIDSYKLGHPDQFPDGTNKVYANFTPRSLRLLGTPQSYSDNLIAWVGFQVFLKDLKRVWQETFFDLPKDVAVSEFAELAAPFCGPRGFNTERLEWLHDVGYLPLEIKALPEGTLVPVGIPVLTITNTLPKAYWLPSNIETWLSSDCWKTPTAATIAYNYRKIIDYYTNVTGGNKDFVQWQGHDFSSRGMSGMIDAGKTGIGHLCFFTGTDNVTAVHTINSAYDGKNTFVGGSVPATEHATMTSRILVEVKKLEEVYYGQNIDKSEDELFAEAETIVIEQLIAEIYPSGVVSIVSDSFDFWTVITKIAPALKDKILNRIPDSFGLAKVVFRPDCYSDDTEVFTNTGWKLFSELTGNDLVAQVLDDGTYEFVTPIKYTKQYYTGNMHHFSDHFGKIDFLVTPNHRMVLSQNGTERIITAEKLGNRGNHKQKMFRSASAKNMGKQLSFIERINIAFQADGSYITDGNKIRFCFSKQRKIDRLTDMLDSNDIKYKKYFSDRGNVEFVIDIDKSMVSKDFEWVDTSNLCGNWCREFIEELSYWDSTRRSDNRFKFDTTNKLVIDKIELIAISAGYGCLLSSYIDNRKDIFSEVFTVHIMKDNTIGGQSWTNTPVFYDGYVYCVSVPSGKLMVKRNKSILVCGNSGDPVKILCGHSFATVTSIESYAEMIDVDAGGYNVVFNEEDGKYYTFESYDNGWSTEFTFNEISEAEVKGAVECLWDIFGGTTNDRGFRTLNQRVGLIYGDSITMARCEDILRQLAAKGFASDNVVFGIGSYTYQYLTRDTCGFAMKATYVEVDGEPISIFKNPKTDSGTKKSAKGLLQVVEENGTLVLKQDVTWEEEKQGLLRTVFLDGKILIDEDFATIRNRIGVIKS